MQNTTTHHQDVNFTNEYNIYYPVFGAPMPQAQANMTNGNQANLFAAAPNGQVAASQLPQAAGQPLLANYFGVLPFA